MIHFGRIILLLIILLLPATPVWAKTPESDARHEKWVFVYAVSQRAAAPVAKSEALADMSMAAEQEHWRPNRGLELFFYNDGTFKIRDWFYGESTGLLQSYYTGAYSEPPEPGRLELVFDTERRPQAPYFMHVLRDNRIDTLANPLARCHINILDDQGDNWLKTNIVCYDDEGLTFIMGQAMFTKEALATPKAWFGRFTGRKASAPRSLP